MAGFTQARQIAILDTEYPTSGATDHIAYSSNGSSENTAIARTPIGSAGWLGATNATPSVKSNKNELVSASASAAANITHFAVYSALTGGQQKTDWQALDAAQSVSVGGSLIWAVGALKITLD